MLLFTSPEKGQRLQQLQPYWKLIPLGNGAKLPVFQVLVGGNTIHNCAAVMHARMVRSHLRKAVLLHCSSSFFSLLFLLLHFTLRKNRKPYKGNNSALEKVDLTIFMIQLKPKKILTSATFCGINGPLHAVSGTNFVQRYNIYSVPAFLSRNTRNQENLTQVKKALLI